MEIKNLAADTEDFTGNVWQLSNGENVLIDTGTGDCWENISQLESVDKVVITHSHHDHVDNLPKVLDKFSPEIYAFKPENLPVESNRIEEGEKLELAGADFKVIHTPGHKDDSICLYSLDEKILFSGDLIFPEGQFGRTDLEEGKRDQLIDSIEKIEKLDVEKMFSGHGDAVLENANENIKAALEEAKKHEPKY